MRIWIAYCNSDFIPAFYKLLFSQDQEQQAELRDKLISMLYFIEKEAFGQLSEGGDFFFGENISLVDVTFYPFFERFLVNEYYRQVKIPNDCQQIRRWIKLMRQRPAVKATANSPEFYIERYAKYADASGIAQRSGAKQIIDDLWG